MRTHGWSGSPPQDDDEARARILATTRARLGESGSASISDVATALGVTRQTVYRYYRTTDDLLLAAALDSVTRLQVQLVAHVREHLARTGGDAGDAAVEVVAYVYDHLRGDPATDHLLAPGRISATLAGLTAPSSIAIGGELLTGFGVDWDALGLDDVARAELVEHLLRTLQSFVLDPGEPARNGDDLRAYLQRWVAPALRVGAPVTRG